MRRIISVLLLFVIYIHCFAQGKDFVVYQKGNEFAAKDVSNDSEVIKNKRADIVIQGALDKLKETGGSVSLLSGKYIIENQIQIPGHVTFRGQGAGTAIVIKKGATLESAIYSSLTSKVVVEELAVLSEDEKAKQSGVIYDQVGDCKVLNVSVSGLGEHGILLRNSCFLTEVSGCRISNCEGSGIFLKDLNTKSRGGDYVPNLVTNCMIYGGNHGVELDSSLVVHIIGCELYMTKSYGFYFRRDANSILISGCRTFQLRSDAVHIVNSHEININGNFFSWLDGHGIVLDEVMWGTITGNNIIDIGHINIEPEDGEEYTYWVKVPEEMDIYANLKDGILMKNNCMGLTITGNAIFNWGSNPPLKYGIEEDATCSHNIISANNINYFHDGGILSEGKNTIVDNNISVKEPFRRSKNMENKILHRYDPGKVQNFIEETRKPYNLK